MLESALDTAATRGLMVTDPVWVPGSMEKPLALKRLLLEPSVDGAVVLGIIEQGQTAHGRVMGQAVINAILNLARPDETNRGRYTRSRDPAGSNPRAACSLRPRCGPGRSHYAGQPW